MKVQLTTITPDPEKITVEIARVSSTRKDKTEDPVPPIFKEQLPMISKALLLDTDNVFNQYKNGRE